METKEKLWSKYFILALIITVGVNLTCNLLLSTISIYAKKITGVDSYAGVMTGAFTLAALFIRILAGKLLDKLGRKKILILGIAITAFSTIGYIFSNGIVLLVIFRVIQGFGFGISSTAIATIVTDVTPLTRILEGIGYSGVGITITTAIGPSMALHIVGSGYNKFNLLFITTFAVAIITILAALFLSYEKNINTHCEKFKIIKSDTDSNGISKEILVPSFILFLAAVAESTILSFTALYGIELGFSNIGLFFTINALGILASRLFINQIVDKLGMNTVLSIGLIIFAFSIFGMAMVKTMYILLILGFLCGIMMGSLLPIINVMILNTVSQDKKGVANAIYYALLDGGYGIGSILWGSIVITYGYRAIYALAGIVLAVAFVIFALNLFYRGSTILKRHYE
ncbi:MULTISPECIES: MFS transporter [Clostridium]|uniref:Major facilitator superfamily protein n=1 Tax=Clostridium sporogenes TaxID=1509 RepID=A0A7U4LM90_CLOSG|nr:MFS transporter [Clostridium sporogenes]AVP59521.1 MFS transporter [Clostridium botulinum]AKC62082.1 major facilitator superfamily protein [Clostridium sporogenes]AKJ89370.1 MFS transporter [Clostridium sporogenes]EHN16133.1 major facilitator superfamily protein [Clostridium sporogenes PA 3679]KCZ69390.1 major facilitator superfamily protein [Clostridium sporogenes]